MAAPGDAALLPALASSLIDTARASAPRALVSWTSHDHPKWHRLPWRQILGPGGVDLHAPQLYAADTRSDAPEGHRQAAGRLASAAALAAVTNDTVTSCGSPTRMSAAGD